jgi:hypothetical protein
LSRHVSLATCNPSTSSEIRSVTSVCASFRIGLLFFHPHTGKKGATNPDDAKFSAARGHDRSRSRAVRFRCAGGFDGPESRNGPSGQRGRSGSTGTQPEGTFLNLINWIGNVIAPVGAGGAALMAIGSFAMGRGFAKWVFTAIGLLMVSGVTRLLEYWIAQGTAGVT